MVIQQSQSVLHHRWLVLHLGCAVIVAALFAYHVSSYYFLGDDSFISFRYARNLVEGNGLVFNPGERVEGYTNFLWVLMMAAAMRLGLAPEIVSNVIGIASGVGILILLVALSTRQTQRASPFIWIAPLCLAVNRTFCGWSTGGLATQFFSLLGLAGLLCFLREQKRGTGWPWGSSLIFAVATLTRPEGVIFFGVAAGFFLVDVFITRRRKFLSWVIWALPYVAIVGAHVSWRYWYYGYLLPNTFYAKVSGLWWDQSSFWFGCFIRDYYLWFFLPLPIVLLVRRCNRVTLLFTAVLAAYGSYLMYIGGDIFEYRFLTPLLPYIYWILQEAIVELFDFLQEMDLPGAIAGPLVALAALMAVAASAAANYGEPSVSAHDLSTLERIRWYGKQRSAEGQLLRRMVEEGLLSGQERIAVTGAGALPYYSRFPVLDCHGLSDVTIAHQRLASRGMIGHEKKASAEYLRKQKVVIFDIMNGLFWPEQLELPRHQVVMYEGVNFPLHCVEYEGRSLVFATTLPEYEFRQRLRRLKIIF